MAKLCPNCGKENENSAKFCFDCGTTLKTDSFKMMDENMIEVIGIDETGLPQVISFDGRILEIIAWLAGKIKARRFHTIHVERIEIQERGNRPPLMHLKVHGQPITGTYEFKNGGENIRELVDAVNQAMSL